MAKLTLSDLTSLTSESTAIASLSANNALTETALENTLSRDGTSPNQMEASLDMNSNRIFNLPAASSDTEPVRQAELDDVVSFLTGVNIPVPVASGGTGTTSLTGILQGNGASAFTAIPSNQLTISSGKVGIGTATPADQLTVTKNQASATVVSVNNNDAAGAGQFAINGPATVTSMFHNVDSNAGFQTTTGTIFIDAKHATGQISFRTGSTPNTQVTINSVGLVSLLAGQLKFPATANPSSDVNTLDDYEEGVWTPVLTFVTPGNLSVAYSTQAGTYTKIGRKVSAEVRVITSSFTHTTASGNVYITGLPFAAGVAGFGSGYFSGITKTNYTNFALSAGRLVSTNIDIAASGSGVTAANVSAADMPTGGSVIIVGSFTYFV